MRELAYQLWAYTCGRNATKVARVLGEDHDAPVPVRTVQYWASADRWGDRVREDLASIAPDLHQTIVSELILGAVESARLLRRSVGDDLPGSERPDKVQVQAAFGLLDRAGYSPLGRVSPVQPEAPALVASLPDLAGLPLAEVERLEQARLDTLRAGQAERLRQRRKG